nr:hypothetical protein Q903MT_gene4932 [Picea sitchensis]
MELFLVEQLRPSISRVTDVIRVNKAELARLPYSETDNSRQVQGGPTIDNVSHYCRNEAC